MPFFESDYTVRRASAPYEVSGLQTADFTEETVTMHVQVVVPSNNEFTPAGQRKSDRLSSWSDVKFNAADAKVGTVADQLLYGGDWYECMSCRYRDRTILHHWRGEWQRLPEGSEKYDSPATPPILTPTG